MAKINHYKAGSGERFIGVNLSGEDFSRRNLRKINFLGSDLSNTDFSHTNLKYAILKHCDLTRADLSHANLTGASLRDAILIGCNLVGADLTEADVKRADFELAMIYPTQLKNCKNLKYAKNANKINQEILAGNLAVYDSKGRGKLTVSDELGGLSISDQSNSPIFIGIPKKKKRGFFGWLQSLFRK